VGRKSVVTWEKKDGAVEVKKRIQGEKGEKKKRHKKFRNFSRKFVERGGNTTSGAKAQKRDGGGVTRYT